MHASRVRDSTKHFSFERNTDAAMEQTTIQDSNGNSHSPIKTVSSKRNVDHGWAWVVLCALFVAISIAAGHAQNTGTFFSVFLEVYQRPRSVIMWMMALQGTANSLAGGLAGFLVSKYGTRVTMMIGAITLGSSFAFMYFVDSLTMAIVCFGFNGIGHPLLLTSVFGSTSQYFEKRLYLVMGLVTSGIGIGTLIIGVELEWALEQFGWRTTMLIQSAIVFQICLCAALVYNNDRVRQKDATEIEVTKSNNNNNNLKKTTKFSMRPYWCDLRFVLQTFGILCFIASRDTTIYIMKDLYQSHSLESYPYSYVVICFGLGSTVGNIISGFATMILSPPLCSILSTLFGGASLVLLLFSPHSGIYLLIGIGLFGFFTGQVISYQNLNWSYMFGKEAIAAMFGYSYVFTFIPRLGVPPIAGLIKDKTGSYAYVIILSTFSLIISALSYSLAYLIHQRKLKAKGEEGQQQT